jgi:hypothetical protein
MNTAFNERYVISEYRLTNTTSSELTGCAKFDCIIRSTLMESAREPCLCVHTYVRRS